METTSGNLKFRIASLDDAPQVQQLMESAFRADDSRPGWTDDLGLSAEFRMDMKDVVAMISNPDSVVLIATDENNALVGCIGTSKRDTSYARLLMLAVDQGQQRGGVGRQILAYAEDYGSRVWGATTFGLNALSNRKQLISWYGRRGYKETGETAPFPREKFPTLILPDDLCFVELEKAVTQEGV